MKISFIILKGMPFGGGIEKYTEEVGSRLAAKGHDIVVYTMTHYGARSGIYKGMKIETIPTVRNKNLEKMVAAFIATIKSVREFSDIVHFHAFGPAMFCMIPKLLGRKVVVQGHGIEWQRSRWGFTGKTFLKLTEYPSVKVPHAVTVVSKVQQRYVKETYNRESTFIPTGVNPPTIERPDLIRRYGLEGNDYILFAARLVREKGAHYLIDAFRRLRTNLKLVIAGDAQHEEPYKATLHSLANADSSIRFIGFATGRLLNELFSNAFAFVLPSEIEGLSTALLEAMSYGNCCLASDIPENREALCDHGYYFSSGDVDDLSKKLEFLVHNPAAVEAVKHDAQKYVLENYLWDDIAARFETFYEEILKK